MRLSILFSGFGGLEETFQAVRQADKEGLDGVWSAEHLGFHDAVVPRASYLAMTKKLEVGLVGLSTAGRHPGLLAMELMSLSELGPNRIRVQVGTGAAPLVAQLGHKIVKPVTATRAFVTSLREACSGSDMRVEHPGFKFEGFKITPLGPTPAIDVMAIRPKMVQLAAQVGDGLSISFGASHAYLRSTVKTVERELQAVGRDRAKFRITAHVIAAVSDDLDPYFASLPVMMASFPQDMAAILAQGVIDGEFAARVELEEGPGGVRKMWTADAINQITMLSTPAQLREKLAAYSEIGIDEVALMFLNPADQQPDVVRQVALARPHPSNN